MKYGLSPMLEIIVTYHLLIITLKREKQAVGHPFLVESILIPTISCGPCLAGSETRHEARPVDIDCVRLEREVRERTMAECAVASWQPLVVAHTYERRIPRRQ
eukprot:scaffold106447_cov57-Attheya_sp.AAC.3